MDLALNMAAAAAALTEPARRAHQWVLTVFATTGRAPAVVDIERAARARDPGPVLAELIEHDLLAIDDHGALRAAYPFSPTPTAHTVTWADGPTVHAMCAIDALGMSAMLARPVTITSTEPGSGAVLVVAVAHDRADWQPSTAVVLAGATGESCCAAVDRTCGHINFFTTAAAATAWAAAHPELTGTVLDQQHALAAGIAEFGAFL